MLNSYSNLQPVLLFTSPLERVNRNLSVHYNKFHGSKKELREKFFENLPEMLCETKYFSV